jgi:hypothetical protein
VHPLIDSPAPRSESASDPVRPDLWFGVDFRNIAGFNRRGARTFDERIPKIVDDIAHVGRAVVCVVELPNPKVAGVSAMMGAIGYGHAAGARGRHIYVQSGVHTVGRKVFDLRPRYRGDDKQGIAVQVDARDVPALVVTAHLENRDASGTIQVGQATHLVDQGEAYAHKRGIPRSHIVWALDTNSHRRVRAEVFEHRGYVDVFDVAHSAENTGYRSFVPWNGRPVEGDRIDLIAVHASRSVRRARLRLTPILTDHLDIFADLGIDSQDEQPLFGRPQMTRPT